MTMKIVGDRLKTVGDRIKSVGLYVAFEAIIGWMFIVVFTIVTYFMTKKIDKRRSSEFRPYK